MSSAEVLELRQYTLRPGARSTLVELFERELIEPQEAAGMRVGGLFLDRDDPDRFVWFRGFTDMAARRRALEGFYRGPVWRRFRDDANATMLDSDDVLLLRPTSPHHPPADPDRERPAVGADAPTTAWVSVTVYTYPPNAELTTWLTGDFHAEVQQQLGIPVATWRTEPAENTFPDLPVRDGNAFVWTATFPDQDGYRSAWSRWEESAVWQSEIQPRLAAQLTGHQHLRLQPTARSQHPAAHGSPMRRPTRRQ
jgi:hypothetical protein